jgi:small subunit ribosomal protein S1
MNFYKPEGFKTSSAENIGYLKDEKSLREALIRRWPLEAKATLCDLEHNLIVDFGFIKGKIFKEDGAIGCDTGETKDIALISRVNKPICFYVKGFYKDEKGEKWVKLNRREVQSDAMENYIKTLSPGDIIDGIITHIESFGCFVDIGAGIIALLPIDSISVSRISHPKDRFKVGQIVKVIVKSIAEDGKITLSHKELLGTWEENAERFNIGETVPGVIRSVEPYGIFIELSPNLAGLAEYSDDVKVGDNASVYIKNIIPEKMKIKLIIVDSFEGEKDFSPPEYFFKGEHIDVFNYSPSVSDKIIRTEFY